ncbi:hypothetical protein K438DRAFT_318197 [Mycena galopus ATCC 62051]|nr:hypothetical protein K438DRAFT_318197 [Mycena galopus ATCC 62051]
MLEDLKASDEERVLLLEEEFEELTMKEGELMKKEAKILLQLSDTRAEKRRVRRLIAETQNRYAPIFTLPDELLVSIVQAAQESPDPPNALAEVAVSQVSQRFRWAVLGASSLWSSIELRWGATWNEERLAVYLARSRSCSLSVELKYDAYHGGKKDEYGGFQFGTVPRELHTVAEHIPRIRRLVLRCDGDGLPRREATMDFDTLHAPCLEHLEMYSYASAAYSVWAPSLSIFNGGAPRLTTLKLNNIYPTLTFGKPNPWISGLTRLDLRGMRNIQGINPFLLATCTQLIDLTLDNSTFFLDLFLNPTADAAISRPISKPIMMPSLRCLRGLALNDEVNPHTLIGILSDINAPALEVLQFSGSHINVSQITSFFNFPSQFPALKSLTFANSHGVNGCTACGPSPQRIYPEALERFTALESLTIVNVCHVNMLLAQLLAVSRDADDTPSCALSSLHTLTLRYQDSDDFGIAGWPKLQFGELRAEEVTPNHLDDLQAMLASHRDISPIRLRLPRSRFFTERQWNPDPNFEIFDVEPLLQSLGYSDGTHYVSESTLF